EPGLRLSRSRRHKDSDFGRFGLRPVCWRVGCFCRTAMKTCSYCGRQNDDTAIACSECGTGMVSLPAPEVDAQLSDPAAALVIVGNFNTMAQASLLSTCLEAAGIESCIPEE